MLASADDNIRLDTHALQVLYACLGGLRLQLLGAFQVRNQSNVYQNSVLMAHLVLKLTDGFQKGLTFNIANGSPYLNDGDAGVRVGKVAVKAAFDFIGDVGESPERCLRRSRLCVPSAERTNIPFLWSHWSFCPGFHQ